MTCIGGGGQVGESSWYFDADSTRRGRLEYRSDLETVNVLHRKRRMKGPWDEFHLLQHRLVDGQHHERIEE